jgi:hypothetical protein
MRGLFVIVGLFVVVLAAGCGFNPHPKDGKLSCSEGCPSGYQCRADNHCWRSSTPVFDSGIDGAPATTDSAAADLGVGGGDGVTAETGRDSSVDGRAKDVVGNQEAGSPDLGGSADTGGVKADAPVGGGGTGGNGDASGAGGTRGSGGSSSAGGSGGGGSGLGGASAGGSGTAGRSGGVGGGGAGGGGNVVTSGGAGGSGGVDGGGTVIVTGGASGGAGGGTGGSGGAGGTGGTSGSGGMFSLGGTTGTGGTLSTGGVGTGGTMAACEEGSTKCSGDGVQTCTNGQWGAAVACGVRQTCLGLVGTAKCTCNIDPVCSSVGGVCANASTLATCSQDAQACFYQSSAMTCTNGACSGTAGAAFCFTNTNPDAAPDAPLGNIDSGLTIPDSGGYDQAESDGGGYDQAGSTIPYGINGYTILANPTVFGPWFTYRWDPTVVCAMNPAEGDPVSNTGTGICFSGGSCSHLPAAAPGVGLGLDLCSTPDDPSVLPTPFSTWLPNMKSTFADCNPGKVLTGFRIYGTGLDSVTAVNLTNTAGTPIMNSQVNYGGLQSGELFVLTTPSGNVAGLRLDLYLGTQVPQPPSWNMCVTGLQFYYQ